MNILLINPDPHKKGGKKIRKITPHTTRAIFNTSFQPNLGLMTLAALTPKKHQVEIVDDVTEDIDFDGTYDLVGITAMTNNSIRCYEIADEFRQRGKKVVIGGWHPSALPEEAKKHADSVVVGEAEENWPRLLDDIENSKIKPFYTQDKIVDISIIPPIIEERMLNKKGTFISAVEATRGCSVGCKFCSITNKPFYRVFRKRPIDVLIKEIENLPQNFFSFTDASITLDQSYARELFTKMKGLNKRFACNANLHVLDRDDELLKLVAEAGLTEVRLGLESPSQETIDNIGKRTHKVKNYKRVIKKIHDHGIIVFGFFMFGFDTDDKGIFERTLNFMNDLEVDLSSFAILTPYPGTPIYDEMEADGRLLTKDWSKYDTDTVVYKPKNMTPEELLEGTRWAAKEFYSSFSIMRRALKSLKLGFYPFLASTMVNRVYYHWAKDF